MNATLSKQLKFLGLSLAVVALVLVAVFRSPGHSFASATANMRGVLWSDMPDGSDRQKSPTNQFAGSGLGWVSLNDLTDGSPVPYGANVELASTGAFTGQGWSEFGGWLDFAPGGTFPTGPVTTSSNAKIDPACLTDAGQTTCPVVGWARFLAGGTAQSGGWDGWVSLHGGSKATGTIAYGVTYNKANRTFSGYGWGDSVAGWIDFSGAQVVVSMSTCTDAAGIQYTYPTGGTMPSQCVQNLICTDANGTQYSYAPTDPVPAACTTLICTDANGVQYTYPVGGTLPAACGKPQTDLCLNLLGIQSVLPTNYAGDPNYPAGWYYSPTGNGECIKDPTPPIGGCMDPNATNYDPTATYQISGSCIYGTGGGCTPGVDCPTTKPVKPIYKEN